jgi:hypothetical protein
LIEFSRGRRLVFALFALAAARLRVVCLGGGLGGGLGGRAGPGLLLLEFGFVVAFVVFSPPSCQILGGFRFIEFSRGRRLVFALFASAAALASEQVSLLKEVCCINFNLLGLPKYSL